ncbi:MAG: pyridoxal 5'-phosphate synthase glutaminase subunit PdxT [Actinobacteria bacterium]|nr:MAG: pyridoxal 5'-phosphate synthase glutaminase subunit PdxT [Actinomycetota bacterium]
MRIGVLALQGAFREHILMLESLGVGAVAVRKPEQLEGCAGLILPGGESTTIAKLADTYGFTGALAGLHDEGLAIWGTCAGAILISREIVDAAPGQSPLGIMDIAVRRNAYGRQIDSFESDLEHRGVDGAPFRGVFIRAPWIESVGEGVDVLCEHEGVIVSARQGDLMATTFHPELTGDPRIHRYFLEEVVGAR